LEIYETWHSSICVEHKCLYALYIVIGT
jgi:hypothetical protein